MKERDKPMPTETKQPQIHQANLRHNVTVGPVNDCNFTVGDNCSAIALEGDYVAIRSKELPNRATEWVLVHHETAISLRRPA